MFDSPFQILWWVFHSVNIVNHDCGPNLQREITGRSRCSPCDTSWCNFQNIHTYFVKKKTIIFNIFSLKENIHSFFVRNFCSKRTVRIPESLIQNVLISHKNLNSGHEKKSTKLFTLSRLRKEFRKRVEWDKKYIVLECTRVRPFFGFQSF